MEEKKESWIVKLIELLNEFETPHSWIVFKSYDDYDGTFYWVDCDGETEIAWSDSYILSKRFQFVEWLVYNDKIDFDKSEFEDEEEYYFWEQWMIRYTSKRYRHLLMLLSISDNPIDFLISILR